MKMHAKKKAYKRWLKTESKNGFINDSTGRMVARGRTADNSMRRDYCPQSGSK